MVAQPLIAQPMSVEEFLNWDSGADAVWQLIDGVPHAMAPASITHGEIQSELAALIRNHLIARGLPYRVVTAPGIQPRAGSEHNFRIPDLAVSCAPNQPGARMLQEPQVIIEILSPTNRAETRANIWAYLTIPSVREILVLESERLGAELLTREADGQWPADWTSVTSGAVRLESLDMTLVLSDAYRTTGLATS